MKTYNNNYDIEEVVSELDPKSRLQIESIQQQLWENVKRRTAALEKQISPLPVKDKPVYQTHYAYNEIGDKQNARLAQMSQARQSGALLAELVRTGHNLTPATHIHQPVDYSAGDIAEVIIVQPNLSKAAKTWYEHRLALAERVYRELLTRHYRTGQTDNWCEGASPLDYYFIENNFFGIAPLDCRCDVNDHCNKCQQWENEAQDIVYAVIDSFTPPVKPVCIEKRLPVRIYAPNIVVVSVALPENPKWSIHENHNRPAPEYCLTRQRPTL